jgi:tRNA U55 pseudouridine synthase TruB
MFRLEAALTLEQAEELAGQGKVAEQTISVTKALQHLPICSVDARQATMLGNGVVPRALECSLQQGLTQFLFADVVVAVAELDQNGYCRIKRVFNQPDTGRSANPLQ